MLWWSLTLLISPKRLGSLRKKSFAVHRGGGRAPVLLQTINAMSSKNIISCYIQAY